MQLTEKQLSRLKEVIEEFPELKQLAWKLNQSGISWGIAAGTATYIYIGGKELDDVDVWIASEDRVIASGILEKEWETQVSERHQAENIYLDNLDIFSDCRKTRGEETLLDYLWTKNVDEYLTEISIEGIDYRVIAPEDIVVLKMANPRESDKEDILNLEKFGLDKDYLRNRLAECGVTVMTY
ncbi:MAG: hypothetical protein ACOX50_01025 [Patescibacteria group bacterium]